MIGYAVHLHDLMVMHGPEIASVILKANRCTGLVPPLVAKGKQPNHESSAQRGSSLILLDSLMFPYGNLYIL